MQTTATNTMCYYQYTVIRLRYTIHPEVSILRHKNGHALWDYFPHHHFDRTWDNQAFPRYFPLFLSIIAYSGIWEIGTRL